VKLDGLEKNKITELEYEYKQKRIHADSMPDEMMKKRELERLNKEEKEKITQVHHEFRKQKEVLEVGSKKEQFTTSSQAKKEREGANMEDREMAFEIKKARKDAYQEAEREAVRKRRNISKVRKKILSGEEEGEKS